MGAGEENSGLVLIFQTAQALNNFKDVGWDISGQSNPGDDSALTGVGISGAASVLPGATVYLLTGKSVESNPSLEGIKFLMDEKLN